MSRRLEDVTHHASRVDHLAAAAIFRDCGRVNALDVLRHRADVARAGWVALVAVLDVVGDKWTFLVIRDLRLGKRTYGELLDSQEGIPTNILADRLKRLEESGIIEAKPYQERPPRYAYTLTKKGEELGEVLIAMLRWGKRHIKGTRMPNIKNLI